MQEKLKKINHKFKRERERERERDNLLFVRKNYANNERENDKFIVK